MGAALLSAYSPKMMQLFRVGFIIASFLLTSVNAAASTGSIPGGLLAVVTPDTLLKPLLNSTPGSKKDEQSRSVLRGLLEVRQLSCPIGWSGCSSGGCCPIGGQCCANDKCCDTGNHCCQGGGCCELGDNCVQDISTGERGCCPIGRTCVSNGDNPCKTSSYIPCANEDFCCPPGDICYRDSDGDPLCRPPGAPTTREVTLTSTRTSSLTSAITSIATGLTPTVYPTPAPLFGSQNVIVHAGDSRIVWLGTFWLLATSSCNATEDSKKTTDPGQSFTFTVASATSVYLSISARNAQYDITINGRRTTYVETTALDDCKLSWSSGVISAGTTTITIDVRGPAAVSTGINPWSFEFHNFLVSMSGEAAASSGVLSNPAGPNPTSPLATSTAPGMGPYSVVYTWVVTAFVYFFAFF